VGLRQIAANAGFKIAFLAATQAPSANVPGPPRREIRRSCEIDQGGLYADPIRPGLKATVPAPRLTAKRRIH